MASAASLISDEAGRRAATRWQWPLAALLVAWTVFAGCFWGTLAAMETVWRTSETYGHCYLIAPASAWLVWRSRDELRLLQPRPSLLGIGLLLGCCAAWIVAELAGVNTLTQFAVVAMFPALVVTFLGLAVSRKIGFALAFLLLMVPAGDALVPWLMRGTADVTVWAVRASGVPVFREGMYFTLPSGQWSIVEACSGLRYVIAAFVLAALFAHLNFRRFRTQLAFVALALLIAIVANWARAYMVVMIGHLSHMRLAVGADHVVYGWVFFGVVMFAVFWMGGRWHDAPALPDDGQSARQMRAAQRAGDRVPRGLWLRSPGVTAASLLAVVMLPAAAHQLLAAARTGTPSAKVDVLMREALHPAATGPLALQPAFARPLATATGTIDPATATQYYVAYFARQWEGAEMIAEGNAVLRSDDHGWQLAQRRRREIVDGPDRWTVDEMLVKSGPHERMIWSWYSVDGWQVVGDYAAKAATAWAMVRGHGDHSTVNVLMTDPQVDTPGVDQRLSKAAAALRRATLRITEP